ncbi:lipoprotein signal peptidase [Flavitalea flava]
MKKSNASIAILTIIGIVLLDQLLKIYIKTNFHYYEERLMIGRWFRLQFIENDGMAGGWKLHFTWGKIVLTLIRLVAVIWGTFYIRKILRQKRSLGFIVCVSLIYAGILGNLIDSTFYGVLFDKGASFKGPHGSGLRYEGLASLFSAHSYGSLFHGNVVDMLYFPLIRGNIPSWFPIWGGDRFEFFNLIFNIADASIGAGILLLFIFHKRFAPQPNRDNSISFG